MSGDGGFLGADPRDVEGAHRARRTDETARIQSHTASTGCPAPSDGSVRSVRGAGGFFANTPESAGFYSEGARVTTAYLDPPSDSDTDSKEICVTSDTDLSELVSEIELSELVSEIELSELVSEIERQAEDILMERALARGERRSVAKRSLARCKVTASLSFVFGDPCHVIVADASVALRHGIPVRRILEMFAPEE